jgi:hypothetical protein
VLYSPRNFRPRATGLTPSTGVRGARGCVIVTVESLMNTELWQEFERRARREHKQPAALPASLLREYLEIGDDVRLNEEMRGDARRGRYGEADAVRLVKSHRAAKRSRAA